MISKCHFKRMYLKLPEDVGLANLYLEEDQTIWFLLWILRKCGCDRYLSQMILEVPFQINEIYISDRIFREYIVKYNMKHGVERVFYLTGGLHSEDYWKDGVKHGNIRYFEPNGKIRLKCEIKNGLIDGKKKVWLDTRRMHC